MGKGELLREKDATRVLVARRWKGHTYCTGCTTIMASDAVIYASAEK